MPMAQSYRLQPKPVTFFTGFKFQNYLLSKMDCQCEKMNVQFGVTLPLTMPEKIAIGFQQAGNLLYRPQRMPVTFFTGFQISKSIPPKMNRECEEVNVRFGITLPRHARKKNCHRLV